MFQSSNARFNSGRIYWMQRTLILRWHWITLVQI
jgi:hypothetical protein